MKDKDMIDLIYVSNDKTYKGHIDRATFLDQMSHMVKWFAPDCNENAKKLCSLIPEFTSITVTQTVFDSKDVPFFEYTTTLSSASSICQHRGTKENVPARAKYALTGTRKNFTQIVLPYHT